MAAFGLTTTATAQVAVAPDFRAQEMEKAVVAPFESVATEQFAVTPNHKPMLSFANGIWYQRPEGTYLDLYWRRGITVPPFTDLAWINKSSEPEKTVWAYGATAENIYDEKYVEDYNLITRYPKSSGSFYGPFLYVENVDTFGILDSQISTGYPIVVAPDSISTFISQVPATVMYSGFTDFSFGTNPLEKADRNGTEETYGYSRYFEYFHAPAQPLYLEGISFYASLPEGVTEPVAAGSEGVTCYVVLAGDNPVIGNPSTYTDTIAIIPINPEEAEISEYREGYYTTVKGYCMMRDDFGGTIQQPVVIDRDFVLIFDGFNNEGVNFGITMSKVPVEEQYHNGGAYPTVYHALWTSDGARKSAHWAYNPATNLQYNMVVRLNGMFDVAAVDEDCLEMTAPEAGGAAYAVVVEDGVEKNYPGVYIQTVMPYQSELSPEPSYQIEGLPEWLSIADVVTDYYTANNGWVTILNLVAQPMPEGIIGRVAKLRFTSAMGAKSEEITVIQGDKSVGIEMMETTEIQKDGAEYNLAGQRVGKDYKGIVVKNGKKFFKH